MSPIFRRLSEPLPLSEASLLALRPALNAPVLNVGFLPVGPARAAIVAFAEEWGGIGLALGIRSNESGQVAVFGNQESIEPETTLRDALEPVLAELERMGFLFDEDMVEAGEDGRLRAMALWGRLMGEVEMPPAPKAAPREPAATEPVRELPPASASPSRAESPMEADELVLDDLADFELDAPLDVPIGEISLEQTVAASTPAAHSALPPRTAPAETRVPTQSAPRTVPPSKQSVLPGSPQELAAKAALPPTRGAEDSQPTQPMTEGLPAESVSVTPMTQEAPAQKLSKFRHVDEAVEAATDQGGEPSAAGGASQLGRIPLVRVRKGRDGSKRVPYLARILANF